MVAVVVVRLVTVAPRWTDVCQHQGRADYDPNHVPKSRVENCDPFVAVAQLGHYRYAGDRHRKATADDHSIQQVDWSSLGLGLLHVEDRPFDERFQQVGTERHETKIEALDKQIERYFCHRFVKCVGL